MSWLSDRTGIHINSINDITSGRALKEAVKNPLVDIGASLLIPGVGGAITGALGKVGGALGGLPGIGAAAGAVKGAVTGNGGIGGTGLTWADILKLGGTAAEGYADYSQNEAARKQAADQFAAAQKQQADQFGKTYGLQQNAQTMTVADKLNRAPMADKGQYLATNFAAPTPFKPRDYTQGLPQVQGQPQGGAQAQLAANDAAAANYKAGDGGVSTDTLKMLLAKLQGGG